MKNWYNIQNKTGQNTKINIYGEISDNPFEGVSAKGFVGDLDQIDGDIDLHINSPGGNLIEGLAIHNALKARKSTVTVYIDAMAASIASVIAMAGDRVIMPKNTILMIHLPSTSINGTADDLKERAGILETMKASLVSVYAGKTGLSDKKIIDFMEKETWFSAEEAVKYGFADEIIDFVKIKASADMTQFNFKNVPEQFKNFKHEEIDMKIEELTLEELKEGNEKLYNEILDSVKVDVAVEADVVVDAVVVDADAAVDAVVVTAESKTEIIKAEMERIQAVESQLLPGHEELVNSLKFDMKTTGAEAAVAVLQAEKANLKNLKKDFDADKVEAVTADKTEDLVLEEGAEKWTKDFKNSKELQSEFKEESTYLAYKNGVAAGLVKSFSGKK